RGSSSSTGDRLRLRMTPSLTHPLMLVIGRARPAPASGRGTSTVGAARPRVRFGYLRQRLLALLALLIQRLEKAVDRVAQLIVAVDDRDLDPVRSPERRHRRHGALLVAHDGRKRGGEGVVEEV